MPPISPVPSTHSSHSLPPTDPEPNSVNQGQGNDHPAAHGGQDDHGQGNVDQRGSPRNGTDDFRDSWQGQPGGGRPGYQDGSGPHGMRDGGDGGGHDNAGPFGSRGDNNYPGGRADYSDGPGRNGGSGSTAPTYEGARPGNFGNPLSNVIGQVSKAVSDLTSPLFGNQNSPSMNGAPRFFSEQMPRFVGDALSKAIQQPAPGTDPTPRPPTDAAVRTGIEGPPRDASPPPPRADGTPPASERPLAATVADGRTLLPNMANSAAAADPRMAQAGANSAQTAAQLLSLGVPAEPMTAAAAAAMLLAADEGVVLPGLALAQAYIAQTDVKQQMSAHLQQSAVLQDAHDDRDLHNSQQTAADSKRPAAAPDQPLAKSLLDSQARAGTDARIADPRVAETLTRLDAAADTKLLRENADKARNATVADPARTALGEEAKRTPLFAAMAERGLIGGAGEYVRQALDWVGQQARELGFGAQSGEEGVHAMRVVAGLIAAGVVVLVVVGVLYAVRVILGP